jgi:hypothetical protein
VKLKVYDDERGKSAYMNAFAFLSRPGTPYIAQEDGSLRAKNAIVPYYSQSDIFSHDESDIFSHDESDIPDFSVRVEYGIATLQQEKEAAEFIKDYENNRVRSNQWIFRN